MMFENPFALEKTQNYRRVRSLIKELISEIDVKLMKETNPIKRKELVLLQRVLLAFRDEI